MIGVQQVEKQKGGTRRMNKLVKVCLDHDEHYELAEEDHELEVEEKSDTCKKRKKCTDDNNSDLIDYSDMYLEDHPQRQTHQPRLLPYEEYSHRVPNFFGWFIAPKRLRRC